MAENIPEPTENFSLTETLLRDPAVQAGVRTAFGVINDTYERAQTDGKEVTPLAAVALLQKGMLLEVARVSAPNKTYADPEDFMAHCIDLRNPEDVTVARQTVVETIPLSSGDIVLTIEDQASRGSIVTIPGYASRMRGGLYYQRPRAAW